MARPHDLQGVLYDTVERIRDLVAVEAWQQVLADFSKNDLLTLLHLMRHPEARMGDLADYLRAPLNTATGVVARLQRRGLVTRATSPDDKRVVVVSLTDEGRDFTRRTLARILDLAGRVLDRLDEEQVALLLETLDRVLAVLAEDAAFPAPRPVRRIPID